MSSLVFDSRAEFVAHTGLDAGIVHAGGFVYRRAPGSTAIEDLPGWEPNGDVWVEHFGARTVLTKTSAEAETFDSAPAIQAAIAFRKQGVVYLSRGYYRVDSTVTLDKNGLILQGMSSQSTKLFAFHSGPILRVMEQACTVSQLACLSASPRKNPTHVDAVGILCRSEDAPTSQRLKTTHLSDVTVRDQPSHGIVINNAFTGTLDRLWVENNDGHGIVVDRGFAVPASHIQFTPGLCSFNECQITKNRGHGLAFGHPDDDFTTQALRILVNNCEIGSNASDPDVRYQHSQVYCRACEVTLMLNVFKPGEVGGAGVFLAGRCLNLACNRFIGVSSVALIGSYDSLITVGVHIVGFNAISCPDMDTAVKVVSVPGQTSVPRGIRVENFNFNGGNFKLLGTDEGGGAGDVGMSSVGGTRLSVYKHADQSTVNTTKLTRDEELKFTVLPHETVRFNVTLEYTGAPDSEFKCTVFAPDESTCRWVPDSSIRLNENDTVVRAAMREAGETLNFGATNSSHRIVNLKGFVRNGPTKGVVQAGWGAKKSSSSPTTVYSGLSYIEIERVFI